MFFASFPSFSTYKNAKLRHLNHHFRTATKEDPERVSHISNINDFTSIIFPHFQTLKKILISAIVHLFFGVGPHIMYKIYQQKI